MPPKPQMPVMPSLSRAYRVWSGLAVAIFGGIALYFASTSMTKLLPGGSLDTVPYEQAIRDAEASARALELIGTQLQNISGDDQIRLAAFIPRDPEVSSLITNISHLTTGNNNLVLKSIDATVEATPPAEVPKNVGSLAVTLTVKGLDYPKLKTYLGSLVENARLLDFVSASFNPKTPEVTVQLRTYYLKK